MLKVTLKGLAAHKLRFVLTAVAVMIGVAFLSGTLVFTDTIRQTFDDLFASIYKNTDAVVRGPTAFETNFGDQRPRVPASTLAQVSAVPGVKAAEGQIQINYAQIVDANGRPDRQSGPGRARARLRVGQQPGAEQLQHRERTTAARGRRDRHRQALRVEGELARR